MAPVKIFCVFFQPILLALLPPSLYFCLCFFSQYAIVFHHTPVVYFGQENWLFPSLFILLFLSFIFEFSLRSAHRSYESIILVPKMQDSRPAPQRHVKDKALQNSVLSCNQNVMFKQTILTTCNKFYHDFKE